MPGEIAQAFVRVRANTAGFQREVKTGIAPGLKHAALGFAGISAGIFGIEKAGEILRDGISSAAKVQKQLETIDQIFGKSGESVRSWGENVAATLGVTDDAALETAARIGILGKNMGLSQAKSAEMALGFEKLAAAMSQIRGTDPNVTFGKLPLVLAGNIRSLKEMGFAFSQVQIKQKAVELGLMKMKGVLTPAAKAQAIYALVTKDLAYYQKLAASHSDDLLNKQRRLSAEWEQAKQELGTAFLPVLAEFTGYIADEMPKAMQDAKPYLDDFAGGFAAIAAAAKFAAENIKAVVDISHSITSGIFDKLHIPDEFKVFVENGGLFNPLNQLKLAKTLREGLGGKPGTGSGAQDKSSPLSLGSNPRLAGAGVTPGIDALVKTTKDDLDKAKAGSGKIQRYQQLQLDLAAAQRTGSDKATLTVAKQIAAIFNNRVRTTRLTGKALFALKQQQSNALDLVDQLQDSINRDAQEAADKRAAKDKAAADKLAATRKRNEAKKLAAWKKMNKMVHDEQVKLLKERFGPNVGKSQIQINRENAAKGGGGALSVTDFYNQAIALFGQYGSNITSGYGGILSPQDQLGSIAGTMLAGTRAGRVRGVGSTINRSTATPGSTRVSGAKAFVDPLVAVTERIGTEQARRDMAVLRELQKQTHQLTRIGAAPLGKDSAKANAQANHGTGK